MVIRVINGFGAILVYSRLEVLIVVIGVVIEIVGRIRLTEHDR